MLRILQALVRSLAWLGTFKLAFLQQNHQQCAKASLQASYLVNLEGSRQAVQLHDACWAAEVRVLRPEPAVTLNSIVDP